MVTESPGFLTYAKSTVFIPLRVFGEWVMLLEKILTLEAFIIKILEEGQRSQWVPAVVRGASSSLT